MEIRIGLKDTARELAFESSQSAKDIEASVDQALNSEVKALKLTDDKGRLFIVPVNTLAYVEIGADQARRVGFIA
jgi:hypothetical protein